MARIKDQAICIRLIDWSETSQIVALLTEQHGKLRGVAKGAKRMSPGSIARYSGGIELLTLGEIVATTKPTVELATLTEWDLQQPWWHLRRDLQAQQLALYAADLTGAMLADHDPHPRCFEALRVFLAALEQSAGRPAMLARFQWDVLTDCGYRPQLDADARTGEALPDRKAYVFDALAGGLTIGEESNATWGVRRQTVDALRALAAGESPDDAEAMPRVNRLLCAYVRALLDRQLPTMKFVL